MGFDNVDGGDEGNRFPKGLKQILGGEKEEEKPHTQKPIKHRKQQPTQLLPRKSRYPRITNRKNQIRQRDLMRRTVCLTRHAHFSIFIVGDLAPKPRDLQAFVNDSV